MADPESHQPTDQKTDVQPITDESAGKLQGAEGTEPPRCTTPPTKKREIQTWKPDQTPVWKICVEFGPVVVGLVVALIYWNQLGVMSKQLNQMKAGTRASLQSAYDACLSAQIARKALIQVQEGETDTHSLAVGSLLQAAAVTRAEAAEVTISSPETIPEVHIIDLHLQIPGVLKNIGKTSALNLHVLAEVKVFKVGVDRKLDLRFHKGAVNRVDGGLLPEGGSIPEDFYLMNDGKRVVLRRDEAMRLREGKTEYLYFYGQIRYQDVFAVRRLLTFCWHTGTIRPEDIQYAKQCAAYNTTDISRPAPEFPKEKSPPPSEITCQAPKEEQ